MKNLQNVVDHYASDRKKHKRYVAVLSAMSLLISFAVPYSLINPASSITVDDSMIATQLSLAASTESTLHNWAGENGNIVGDTIYSPESLSAVTLLVGDNSELAQGATNAAQVIANAESKYFLGIASEFSLFLKGNAILKAADAEGRVAVGGNLNFEGGYCYQVGSGNFGYMTALEDTDDYQNVTGFAHAIIGGSMKDIHPLSTGNNRTRLNTLVEGKGGHQGYDTTLYFPATEDLYKRFVIADPFGNTHVYCGGGENYSESGSHDDVAVNELAEMYRQPEGGLIDFEDTFKWLEERSATLSQITATGTTRVEGNKIIFSVPNGMDSAKAIYFNIDEINNETIEEIVFENVPGYEETQMVIRETETDELETTTKIVPKCNLVVNCGGTSFNICGAGNTVKTTIKYADGTVDEISNNRDESKRDEYNKNDYHNNNNPEVIGWRSNNHPASSKILYNFYQATELSYINGNFNGTIFAPSADVKSNDNCTGHLSGALIAKSFEGGLEFGYRPYRGTKDILGSSSGYGVPIQKLIAGTEQGLANVTFGIYTSLEEDASTVATFSTNEEGKAYVNIPTSVKFDGSETYDSGNNELTTTYYIKEISAPDGFFEDTTTAWKIDVQETVDLTAFEAIDGKQIPTHVETQVTIYDAAGNQTETFIIDLKDIYTTGADDAAKAQQASRQLTINDGKPGSQNEIYIMDISDGKVTAVGKWDGSSTEKVETQVSSYKTVYTTTEVPVNVPKIENGEVVTGVETIIHTEAPATPEGATTFTIWDINSGNIKKINEFTIYFPNGDSYYGKELDTKNNGKSFGVADDGDMWRKPMTGIRAIVSDNPNEEFDLNYQENSLNVARKVADNGDGTWTVTWGMIPGETSGEGDSTSETTTRIEIVKSWTESETSMSIDENYETQVLEYGTAYIVKYQTSALLAGEAVNQSQTVTVTVKEAEGETPAEEQTLYYDKDSMMLMPIPTNPPEFTNRYGLRFAKVDNSGEPVKGAKVDLCDSDGNVIKEGILNGVSATTIDMDGLIDRGTTYMFRESTVPDGYDKAEDVYFVVSATDNIVQYWTDSTADDKKSFGLLDIASSDSATVAGAIIRMVDNKIGGAVIKLEKVDAGYTNPLSGAVFDLKTANGELVYPNITGNENGEFDLYEIFKNAGNNDWIKNGYLIPGSYVLIETEAPTGYPNGGEFKFDVKKNGNDFEIVPRSNATPAYISAELVDNGSGTGNSGPKQIFVYPTNTSDERISVANVTKIEVELNAPASGELIVYDSGSFDNTKATISNGVATFDNLNNISFEKFKLQNTSYDEGLSIKEVRIYGEEGSGSGSSSSYQINDFVWNDANHNSRPNVDALILCYSDGKSIWYDGITINEGDGNWNTWNIPNVNKSNVVGARLILSGEGSGKFYIQQTNTWYEVLTNSKGNVTAGTYDFGDVSALENCVKVESESQEYTLSALSNYKQDGDKWFITVSDLGLGINEISNYVLDFTNTTKPSQVIFNDHVPNKYNDNEWPWKDYYNIGNTITQEWNGISQIQFNYESGNGSVDTSQVKLTVYYSNETPVIIEDLPEAGGDTDPDTPAENTGDVLDPKLKGDEGEAALTLLIPNKKNESDKITISVKKEWAKDAGFEEDCRPKTVTAELWRKKSGETDGTKVTGGEGFENPKTLTANGKGELTASWTDLEKYVNSNLTGDDKVAEANLWIYYVKEVNVDSDYTDSYQPKNGVKGADGTITITNTLKTIQIDVVKEWENNGSTADLPDSITVNLEYSTDNGTTWNVLRSMELTAPGWHGTFEDLYEGYQYKVVESEISGWTASYSSNQTVADHENATVTITNTRQTGSLEVEKAWDDNDASKRPEDITVDIYRSTTPPADTVKLVNSVSARLSGAMINSIANVNAVTTYASADESPYENYAKLLQYSLYFYDANMCGDQVGETSKVSWRDDCHTYSSVQGGFHDAGDHVMFGLPQGFTASTLGWSYYEFKDAYDSLGQTEHYQTIMKYFCDFFVASYKDGQLLVQKGNGDTDHAYWGRPEDQQSGNWGYDVWKSDEGSNIAADYAAALAQYYLNFPDDANSSKYLETAKVLYEFAEKTRPYSVAGYADDESASEKAWAAAWLYLATKNNTYKEKYEANISRNSGGLTEDKKRGFFWGDTMLGAATVYASHIDKTHATSNSIVKDYLSAVITPGDDGTYASSPYLITDTWGSARHNTLIQTVALSAVKNNVVDGNTAENYKTWCANQMSYILGNNNGNVCLVTGFNGNSVKYPHHRAASVTKNDKSYAHTLVGALAGGSGSTNFVNYPDTVENYTENEVALDYNAGLVGAAAGLHALCGSVGTVDEKDILTDLLGREAYDSIAVEPEKTPKYDLEEIDLSKVEDGVTINMNIGDSKTLVFTNGEATLENVKFELTVDPADKQIISMVDNTKSTQYIGYDVRALYDGVVHGKVTVNDGIATYSDQAEGASISVTFIVKLGAMDAGVPEGAEKVGETVTLSAKNGWKKSLNSLSLCDANGNRYYYYIKETSNKSDGSVDGNNATYFPISYNSNGLELVADETKTITVTNKTDTTNEGITMPSAGGTGTDGYKTAGLLLIGVSVLGYATVYRKKKRTA